MVPRHILIFSSIFHIFFYVNFIFSNAPYHSFLHLLTNDRHNIRFFFRVEETTSIRIPDRKNIILSELTHLNGSVKIDKFQVMKYWRVEKAFKLNRFYLDNINMDSMGLFLYTPLKYGHYGSYSQFMLAILLTLRVKIISIFSRNFPSLLRVMKCIEDN